MGIGGASKETIRCMLTGQSVDNRLTGRLHGTIVGPTGRPDPGYVRLVCQTSRTDRSDRLYVAEPPTSVNQINVAC